MVSGCSARRHRATSIVTVVVSAASSRASRMQLCPTACFSTVSPNCRRSCTGTAVGRKPALLYCTTMGSLSGARCASAGCRSRAKTRGASASEWAVIDKPVLLVKVKRKPSSRLSGAMAVLASTSTIMSGSEVLSP